MLHHQLTGDHVGKRSEYITGDNKGKNSMRKNVRRWPINSPNKKSDR